MDRGKTVMATWSDLPKELLERIGQCLDTDIEVLRFRAVCSSWRSSLAPTLGYSPNSLSDLIKLPFPNITNGYGYVGKPNFYLVESTVFLFRHPDATGGWLVKVIKTPDGKLFILDPLSETEIKFNRPKPVNLLNFRVSQVCKSYHVQIVSKRSVTEYNVGHLFKKILLISSKDAHFSLLGIDKEYKLCYLKSGDKKWTTLKNADASGENVDVDIIVYKGNFYAVDRYGETTKYDPSSFNKTKVSSSLPAMRYDRESVNNKIHKKIKVSPTVKYDPSSFSGLFGKWGRKKRLVESSGHLFLVDMFLDRDYKQKRFGQQTWDNPMDIKIYRLDEEQREWIAVHTLGDQMFFVGDDCCFSVSSLDFGGKCRGNCIYYTNGSLSVDVLGKIPPKLYDDYSEDECCCSTCISYGGYDDDPIHDEDGSVSSDEENDLGSKPFVLSEELKQRYKVLQGHNTGVFAIQEGNLGSLLSFLEYVDVFWPPPSWLNT